MTSYMMTSTADRYSRFTTLPFLVCLQHHGCEITGGRTEGSCICEGFICYAERVKVLEDLRRQRGGKKHGQQNPYYGRRVRKVFEDGVMYEGVVGTSDYDAQKLRSNVFEMIYRVEYEDSEIEDYTLQELQDILVE